MALDRMQTHPPPNYPPPPPPVPTTEVTRAPSRPVTPHSAKSPAPIGVAKTSDVSGGQKTEPNSPSPIINKKKTGSEQPPTRRASLSNLLRRSKSSERAPPRKLSKKSHPAVPPLPSNAPRLPEIPLGIGGPPPPSAVAQSRTIGDLVNAYDTASRTVPASARPSADIPSVRRGFNINEDPYGGVGSITNRGRYSYASSAVSSVHGPRRLRKRKEPVPFNILIVGAANSGKTSFLKFLKETLAPKGKKSGYTDENAEALNGINIEFGGDSENSSFTKTYIETDVDGERLGLTIWDSTGLEKGVVDLQLRETVAFIENKFEETFKEETRISRIPGNRDPHIHCAFLLLDPGTLNSGFRRKNKKKPAPGEFSPEVELDEDLGVQVFRALKGKTMVIPVIAKADTCTLSHMTELKQHVITALQDANINPLEELDLEIDFTKKRGRSRQQKNSLKPPAVPEEEENEAVKSAAESFYEESSSDEDISSPVPIGSIIPLSIISPDHYSSDFVGRKYPWGFADPYNEEHCDFVKLRDAIFTEWRGDLKEASREIWYENWRTSRLSTTGGQRGRKKNI